MSVSFHLEKQTFKNPHTPRTTQYSLTFSAPTGIIHVYDLFNAHTYSVANTIYSNPWEFVEHLRKQVEGVLDKEITNWRIFVYGKRINEWKEDRLIPVRQSEFDLLHKPYIKPSKGAKKRVPAE